METLVKSADAHIKASDTGGFSAYASRFLNIDRQGDLILPGAYAKALPEFLDDGGLILADHINSTKAVAATMRDAHEDKNGLLVDGQFSATETGQRIRQQLKEKSLRKMSISFLASSKKAKEADIHAIWQKYNYSPTQAQMKLAKGGANIISDVHEILEVSFVAIPANRGAEVISVKSIDMEVETETPTAVVDAGSLLQLLQRADLADSIVTASTR